MQAIKLNSTQIAAGSTQASIDVLARFETGQEHAANVEFVFDPAVLTNARVTAADGVAINAAIPSGGHVRISADVSNIAKVPGAWATLCTVTFDVLERARPAATNLVFISGLLDGVGIEFINGSIGIGMSPNSVVQAPGTSYGATASTGGGNTPITTQPTPSTQTPSLFGADGKIFGLSPVVAIAVGIGALFLLGGKR